MLTIKELFILAGTFPLLLLTTYLVKWVALRYKIVNAPTGLVPQHTQLIPYMGGIAIAFNMLLLLLVWHVLSSTSIMTSLSETWLIFAVLFLLFGLYDDLKCLSPGIKFFIQTLLAVSSSYVSASDNIDPYVFFLSVFWILLLVNAFNFIDVMDGLSGGVAIIFFIAMAFLNAAEWQIYIIIAISIVAFMFFNAPPASIFMGDAGSHFIGYLFAVFSLEFIQNNTIDGVVTGLLLVAIPLFELIFITSIRIRKGLPWWRGSPDHMALRLQAAGLSRWQTNMVIWLIAITMSVLAYLSYNTLIFSSSMIFLFAIYIFISYWYLLLKWEVKI